MFQRWLNQHKDFRQHSARAERRRQRGYVLYASGLDGFRRRAVCRTSYSPASGGRLYIRHACRANPERSSTQGRRDFRRSCAGRRVFIAQTKEVSAVGPIASCDAIRGILVKKSVEAGEEPGLDDKERREKSEALRAKSEVEFLRCFVKLAPRRNDFVAAAKAAQALIDRLLSR